MKIIERATIRRLFVVAIWWALLLACSEKRTPVAYLIPAGYRGWVEIDFERPDCPSIPLEKGKLEFQISTEGTSCTSSEFEKGWARDEYYSVGASRTRLGLTGWSEGGDIWGGMYRVEESVGLPPRKYFRFFVGTEAEYKAAVGKTAG